MIIYYLINFIILKVLNILGKEFWPRIEPVTFYKSVAGGSIWSFFKIRDDTIIWSSINNIIQSAHNKGVFISTIGHLPEVSVED